MRASLEDLITMPDKKVAPSTSSLGEDGGGWRLSDELSRWANTFAGHSSIHTFALYRYVPGSGVLRAASVVAGLLGVVGLPFYLRHEAAAFLSRSAATASTEWGDDGPLPYPNITICNPLFFQKRKMNGSRSSSTSNRSYSIINAPQP